MIESRELRIGNWVNHNGTPIELTRNRFKLSVFTLGCSEIEPIPLTEEWLERFGFEKRKISYLYGYGNFLYDYRLKLWTWYGIQLHDYLITYVHQLQNLYFALTGEELQLKET